MTKRILIDANNNQETRIASIQNDIIEDFEYEVVGKKQLRGNVYLARVSRVEPSLQAAFVEYGGNRQGFLAFSEIHPDYYRIPVEDRTKLLETVSKEVSDDDEIQINNDENVDDEFQENKDFKKIKSKLYKNYKIQEVISKGQIILVQIVKEERGNKGAALTSYISLAGKYTVLMPNSTKTKGISRKISTSDDRNKLKQIIDELNIPLEMGLIIRTAGLNKTKNEIKKDYSTLNKLWVEIVTETKKAIAPALIHEEGNLLRRVLRDVYTKEMKDILVEGKESYKETKKYMSQLLPSCAKFVKQYKSKEPIFSKYKVEKEIIKMFNPEVKLRSGGYLVINPTEALVAIDVNSGGATKERNIEKTALKTNLEAAVEIAKQIKIRDLSGLIVIDFIDMYEMRNNRQVEKKIKELVRRDRARTQVSRISQFGLLEMSRQRLRQSFIEWRTELSPHSSALKLIYLVKEKINNKKFKTISANINPFMKKYLDDNFKAEINKIEDDSKVKITFTEDITISNSEIDFVDESTNVKKEGKSTKQKVVKKKSSSAKKKTSAVKKTKSKEKILENKIMSPLKEIKDKKSGWWQK